MQLALFQPEIAQNVGTLLRLGACLGINIHIIEPCGFIFDDKKLRRSGMDYLDLSVMVRHASWDAFLENTKEMRVIATSPRADKIYTEFDFQVNDIILMGPESVGLPEEIMSSLPSNVKIPMKTGTRSLNIAVSAAMIVGEGLRQTGGFL